MREHYINADFDLSLRRGRTSGTSDARSRQADELTMHLLLLGVEGDSILARAEPQGAFLDYLQRLRIPPPQVCVLPLLTKSARFTPFGWNEDAVGRNRFYEDPSPHPPLDVVRRVNGRRYSADVERRHWGGEHVVGVVHSADEIATVLSGRPAAENGWVVKSEHGNGAFGNRRLRSRDFGDADRNAVERLMVEDGCAVVERWCERVLDLATVFAVDEIGEVSDLHTYEVVNTADGAFIGDIFGLDQPALDRWGDEIPSMAAVVAAELAGAGYFGPVCVDSFVWNDRGAERLRPVVDINARMFVAAAAERLWRVWGRDRVVYWRLFSTRKLRVPESYADLEKALAGDAFNPATRCGVLLTSPMEVEGRPPRRLGVLLAGEDRAAIDALDHRFREVFEK